MQTTLEKLFRGIVVTASGLATFAANADAQALSVSVRDSAGTAVPQVGLVLLDTTGRRVASTHSGPNGLAFWPKADTGTFRVLARRFGFTPQTSSAIHIGPGDTVVIRLTMQPAPAVLDRVVVVTEKESVRNQWNPFGINLRATGGHIITPTEIEYAILGARDMADVLARRAIPGILIDHINRCPKSNRGGGCLPFVVDGHLYPNGLAFPDAVVPEMVDYVVVLRGAEVGVRYGRVGGGGIILIATKRADYFRRR